MSIDATAFNVLRYSPGLRREELPLHQFRLSEVDEDSLCKDVSVMRPGHSRTSTTSSSTASDHMRRYRKRLCGKGAAVWKCDLQEAHDTGLPSHMSILRHPSATI
jgi:hypothetical protein